MILNSKYSPWNPESLTQLFDIVTGSTPSTKDERFWSDGNVVWVTPADLSQINSSIFINNSERKITEVALNKSNLTILPIDSIILSTRAPVGYVAINKKELCFNQGCKGLVTKEKDYVDPLFYYYYFSYIRNYLESISGGSTFKELSKDSLKNLSLPFPDKKEQTAIANILYTVDEAIQKAVEAINKIERIKRSMLQRLLTKGIGHAEFKETNIGRIPKDWEFESAQKICCKITDGTHDSPKSEKEGFLLYTSKNIKEGQLISEGSYFISKEEFDKANRRSIVNTYDVLFSMIGTVGETAIVFEKPVQFAIKNVGLFKTDNDLNLALWLHYYFDSNIARRYIVGNSKGTTQRYIPLEALRNFPVLIPGIKERDKITSILKDIDNKLELAKYRKFHLVRIKQALMDDLLTGKKRIS